MENPEKGVERILRSRGQFGSSPRNPEKGVESVAGVSGIGTCHTLQNPEKGVESSGFYSPPNAFLRIPKRELKVQAGYAVYSFQYAGNPEKGVERTPEVSPGYIQFLRIPKRELKASLPVLEQVLHPHACESRKGS